MVKRVKAAAVIAALLAAREAQPAKAESIRALLSEWMDPNNGLEKTVVTGKKLEAAVANRISSWFKQADLAVSTSDIPDNLKDAAHEEVDNAVSELEDIERVVRPDPTPEPYGTPPKPSANVESLPKYSDGTSTYKVVAVEGSGDSEKYLLQKEGSADKPFKQSKDEILINYFPVGGRRKTRRGKRKVRRTVKRRAKSLRRRR